MAFRHGSAARPFGEQTGFIQAILKECRRQGLPAWAFGPQDVDVRADRVHAYVWTLQGWRRRRRPLPALVYDRFFLHEPRRGLVLRYRRLQNSGRLRLLNPSVPDKWLTLTCLRGAPHVRHWLPPTVLYRNGAQLLRYLRRWRAMVAKPRRGMKGLGIWFIRRRGREVRAERSDGHSEQLKLQEVERWCSHRLRKRHLLQPELHLRSADDRPFDLRVLIQRDGTGRMDVTGMGVRVGRKGSRVSNLHRGGMALTIAAAVDRLAGLRTALADYSGTVNDPALWLEEAAAQAALELAEVLDGCFGPFGEIAVDLGFDLQRQRLCFLEANSRPGRIIFRRSGDWAARERSLERPVEYALYLLRQ